MKRAEGLEKQKPVEKRFIWGRVKRSNMFKKSVAKILSSQSNHDLILRPDVCDFVKC